MDAERWLAPLTGAIAVGTGLAVVAVYSYGRSLPPEHDVAVSAVAPVSPEQAWALLSDPKRRTEWAPDVEKVGQVGEVAGRETWRELDASEDRFDFSIVSRTFPVWEVAIARPEDIGMRGGWTWTLAPEGAGTRVTVRERGTIDNLLFRGVWAIRTGPWDAIERDAAAFSRALGGDGHTERAPQVP
jgi:hypothetical protein